MIFIIFIYIFLVILSISIMFYMMTSRIKMMKVYTDHYDYLKNDCILSNITETKYGGYLGILSSIFIIPVLFFIMFHVMDVLRIKTYYKNYVMTKDTLSFMNFNVFDIRGNMNLYLDKCLDKYENNICINKSII